MRRLGDLNPMEYIPDQDSAKNARRKCIYFILPTRARLGGPVLAAFENKTNNRIAEEKAAHHNESEEKEEHEENEEKPKVYTDLHNLRGCRLMGPSLATPAGPPDCTGFRNLRVG